MTVVTCPELYPQKRPHYCNAKRDAFLRAHVGISAAHLAIDMGVTERFVITYQRKLGLRPMASHEKVYD